MSLSDPALEKFSADATNRDSLEKAVAGVDVVIQTLGVRLNQLFGPVRLFSDSTNVLIPVMQAEGIKRLICVTGFGSGDSDGAINCFERLPFNFFLGQAYQDKSRQEDLIRHSDLDWTIIRPGILTGGSPTGRYKVIIDRSKWRNGFISRADVADFLVKQINDTSYIGQAPVLVN
jgi:putative NADH-flavin reductase